MNKLLFTESSLSKQQISVFVLNNILEQQEYEYPIVDCCNDTQKQVFAYLD